ncbi:MAG: ribosome recycling factor [Hyphomicrobiales bacterium]
MSDNTLDLKDIEHRMERAVEVLKEEFGGLRTGRASASLLEPLVVEAYGAKMPMNQVGTISVPESRMITVQVWDNSLVSAVEKAIRESSLGLNPMTEGQLLRVPLPELTQERRAELSKVAGQYAEQARVAIRNIRKHSMDALKKAEKDSDISEDLHRDLGVEVQTLTDTYVGNVDETLAHKEEEIMQV